MLARLRGYGDRGQDLVEFALILPVLLLLLLGIMEFGIVIFTYDTIANAAREGARYGIIHHEPGDDSDIEAATRRLTTGLDPAALGIDIDLSDPNRIQVEIFYEYNLITGPVILAVGGNPALNLHTVATMYTE